MAVAVAQPVKRGNTHQLCFSPGQRARKAAEQAAWEAIPVRPLVRQDLSPLGGLLAVPVPGWAVTLPQGLLRTQELLDPELLRTAAISSQALPWGMSRVLPAIKEVTEGEGDMWVGKWSIPEQRISLLPFHPPDTKLAAINSSEVCRAAQGVEDAQGMGVLQ